VLKIKHFSLTAKPLQRHCKATAKRQTVENQALREILCSFAVLLPKHTPKPTPHPLARFLHVTRPFFLYISLSLQKLQNKKQKTKKIIERVALGSFAVFFAVALQWLCSFLTIAKNCIIIKPHQAPTLAPPHHQTVEIQALHDTNQTLETQALSEVPSKLNNVLRFF